YIEFEKGNYEKALEYYLEALRLFQNYDMNGTFEAYHALSQLSIAQGNTQLAKEHSEKASELLKEINKPFETTLYHELMGMIYTTENKWDEADNEFKEGLKVSSMALDKWLTPRIHFRYSEMYLKKGEPEKACEFMEQALAEFERMGMKLWEDKARKVLADIA
ncbi:MAG: tetratricopeptide repeat protein, partial [Thermoplasmata archaeon]|nr:tetratricopeptide repeat protein [Thermoplasmata archaeon]